MTAEAIPDYPFTRATALEPPAELAELREKCPVAHVRLPSGDVAGLVPGYDDARAGISAPRFSRNLAREGAARMSTTKDGGLFSRRRMGSENISEGEGHLRWRRLLSRWFTVRRVAGG